MEGRTWDERKPGDWLASNGRWYQQSKRPRGWNLLALPPAPGHGAVTRVFGRTHSTADTPSQRQTSTATPRQSTSPPPREPVSTAAGAPGPPPQPNPSSSVVRTGRRVADATATHVSTYKRRIERGPQSAGSLPAPPSSQSEPTTPEPPGRRPSAPTPPAAPPAVRPRTTHKSPTAADVAGDLGRVISNAKKRLEEAINEASKGQH